jgi:DNA-binding FadR family transcriptional regulator
VDEVPEARRTQIAGTLSRDGRPAWQRPARLASVIVEAIAEQIISGTLAEGDVLPTEPVLCEEFGFSRTVVREGIKLLEERGLVRVVQGRGTTVQARSAWNMLDPVVLRIALEHDDLSLLDDLISVRRVLEHEMTRAATPRLTEDDLETLAGTIDRMEHSYDDYGHFRALDNAFHATVMKASGNEVGMTIVRVIHAHGGVTQPLASGATRAALRRTTRQHREIYEALAARDGDRAAELISAHIDSGWAERRRRAPSLDKN